MADRKTAYQAYRNRVVGGSIPPRGTTIFENVGSENIKSQQNQFEKLSVIYNITDKARYG